MNFKFKHILFLHGKAYRKIETTYTLHYIFVEVGEKHFWKIHAYKWNKLWIKNGI